MITAISIRSYRCMATLNVRLATINPSVARGWLLMSKRIGIFSGTFDPIHKGHIAFALAALKEASLNEVYFMPETKPRRKEGITHYAHRIAMLQIALKPYRKLKILEVSDKQFSVNRTMPRLKGIFKGDELFLLVGSDAAAYLADVSQWPDAGLLLKDFGLIVGFREDADEHGLSALLSPMVKEYLAVHTDKKHVSSRKIRHAAAQNQHHEDALKTTKSYMKKHWIYDSVTGSANRS